MSCTCVVLLVARITSKVFGDDNSELLWWEARSDTRCKVLRAFATERDFERVFAASSV